MARPATAIPSKKKASDEHSKRPHSVSSFHYLKDKKPVGISSNSEPAWRSRVKSVDIPSKSRKKKSDQKPCEPTLEGFDLEQYVSKYPEGNPMIGVNGKPSDSSYSKTVLKTVSNRRKYGSLDRVPSSDEDDVLEEVFALDSMTLNPSAEPLQRLFKTTLDGRPLCWNEATQQDETSPEPAMPKVSTKQKGSATVVIVPTAASPSSSIRCPSLSPLTSSVSILRSKSSSGSSKDSSNNADQCVLVPLDTSSASLDFLITWQDVCVSSWTPSLAHRGGKGLVRHSNGRSCSGGLQINGTTAFGSAELDAQLQDATAVEALLKRMIASSSVSHRDASVRGDLLCIWFKLPNLTRPDQFHSFFHLCEFDVYFSQSTASQISTHFIEKQSPSRVVHNLFVLKLSLTSCLPWLHGSGGTKGLEGRRLELLLYLVKPHRFRGCVYQEVVQLSSATPTTPPPSRRTDSNCRNEADGPHSSQPVDQLQRQVRETNRVHPPDRDCLQIVRPDLSLMDPSSPQAQEFILSHYKNPYQISVGSCHMQQHIATTSLRRQSSYNSQVPTSYTSIVRDHIKEFVGDNGITNRFRTSTYKHKVVSIPTQNSKSRMKTPSARSATGGSKKSVHFEEANHFETRSNSITVIIKSPF